MSLMNEPQPTPKPEGTPVLQTISRFATAGVFLSLIYLGWTFYSRNASDEQAARDLAAKQQAERQHQADLIFGSGEVKIVSYSIDKASIARGESADLCYGVVNTTKVVIEPHVEDSKPSSYHCLSVSPRATTTYTITASNDKGEAKSLSVSVKVH